MALSQRNLASERPSTRENARIRSVASIEVPVTDMNRSIEFYVDHLGFYLDTTKNPLPIGPNNTEVFICPASGPSILLVKTEGKERLWFTHREKPNRILIFETDEEPGDCLTRFRASGYKSGELRDAGGCGKALDVSDPDGNVVTLWFGHPRSEQKPVRSVVDHDGNGT